jgi:sensor histidine kinase regulating citrate/malate metabolism
LLNNSIKAIASKEKKIVKVTATAEDDALTILFSDNGIGIKEADRNKIFEVYHTTTAEEGGNGMGLYMIKTNINAVNGSIQAINSELDQGATFQIVLPFKR